MTTERTSYDGAGADAVAATRADRMTGSMDRAGDAAAGVVDRVSGTAEKQANMGLARAGDAIAQAASAIRQTGEQMRGQQPQVAGFADTAAQQLDKAAQLVREQDLQGLIREAERFARRQPALFLGGAFVLGLAASRFLKASPENGRSSGRVYESGYGARDGSGYGARATSGYGARYTSGHDVPAGYDGSADNAGTGAGRAMSTAGSTATGDLTGVEHGRA
jgi:hypothetical protein